MQDKDGFRVERTAIIELDSIGSAEGALFTAISDATLPAIGDAHPSIATIYLNSIAVDPLSAGKYRVTMSYADEHGIPGNSNIAITASAVTVSEPVQSDVFGGDFLASYTTTTDAANTPATLTVEYFTANVEKPQTSYTFEFTVTGAFPKTTIDTYLGHINTSIWNSYAAESVLCSNVEVNQQGVDWRVRMTFVYNVNGWKFNAVIAVPMNKIDSVDVGVDPNTGVKTFDFIYPIAEFNDLSLTL